MPRGSPFTQLCSALSAAQQPISADLHLHTTASDGENSPDALVQLVVQANLKCIAITDHDTLTLPHAPSELMLIPAAEFSASWQGREWHILGYFLDTTHQPLLEHFSTVCQQRRKRFELFIEQFQDQGALIPDALIERHRTGSISLGRRHLQQLLVEAGMVRHRHEAYSKWIGPAMATVPALHLTPLDAILNLIQQSGGLSSLAHPPSDLDAETLVDFQKLGLNAIETRFPVCKKGLNLRLEQLARNLGLGITGGSDYHAAEFGRRSIGSHGLKALELDRLRELYQSLR